MKHDYIVKAFTESKLTTQNVVIKINVSADTKAQARKVLRDLLKECEILVYEK